MSVASAPVQLLAKTFDFALLYSIKQFWIQYKSTFTYAQLYAALKENEQLWLDSKQRNCNELTYRTSVQISLKRLCENAGINVHNDVIPYIYELVDYDRFIQYEHEIVKHLHQDLIKFNKIEHKPPNWVNKDNVKDWLLKLLHANQLTYHIIYEPTIMNKLHSHGMESPSITTLCLTDEQLKALARKSIQYGLVQLETATL